jgi:hypothetical protein
LYAEIKLFECSNPWLLTRSVLLNFSKDLERKKSKSKQHVLECRKAERHAPLNRKNRTIPPHLGSEIFAEWRTRPQYVLRSYCDSGNSRLPGKEADILGAGRPQNAEVSFSIEKNGSESQQIIGIFSNNVLSKTVALLVACGSEVTLVVVQINIADSPPISLQYSTVLIL